MIKYVIFDCIQNKYLSGIYKDSYCVSFFYSDALRFPSRSIALSFLYILECLYPDNNFIVKTNLQ